MNKIKHFIESEKGKDILTVIIVILVGLASFGLGRLSKEAEKGGVEVLHTSQDANVISATDNTARTELASGSTAHSKAFFASSRGTKYYSIGCSGGKTLKPENKIYFSSAAEAEQAGYELSSTCK